MLPTSDILVITLLVVLFGVIVSRIVTGVLAGGLIDISRSRAIRRQMRAMRRATCDGILRKPVSRKALMFAHDNEEAAPVVTVKLQPRHAAVLQSKYGVSAGELRSCTTQGATGADTVHLVCPDKAIGDKVALVRRCDPALGFQCRTSYAGFDVPRVRCVYNPHL